MPQVVRRAARVSMAASVAVLLLSGCGGPGQRSTAASSAPVTTTALPAPTGPGCGDAGDIGKLADKGLVEALSAMPATTQFAAYATLDGARAKKLNALDGVTVFVPVDAAWGKLDATTLEKLADPKWRSAALEYSIVAGSYSPADFEPGKAHAMATFRAAGVTLSGVKTPDGVIVNGVARVSCSAIPIAGGLVYLTDTLLMPPS